MRLQLKQALSVTHVRKSSRTRAIKSVLYGRNAENEPVSRIKMADYHEYGSAIAIFETKPLYEKRQINFGASTILMSTWSCSCVSCG